MSAHSQARFFSPLGFLKRLLNRAVVPQSESVTVPDTDDAVLRIPAQFITYLHGKAFVQFGGLFVIANEHGLQSLNARFMTIESHLAMAEATAVFEDGRCFTECGDASPDNMGEKVRPHLARMALTRAKARALRDTRNIGICSVEELAD